MRIPFCILLGCLLAFAAPKSARKSSADLALKVARNRDAPIQKIPDEETAALSKALEDRVAQLKDQDELRKFAEEEDSVSQEQERQDKSRREPYALGFTLRSVRKHLPHFLQTKDNQLDYLLIHDSQKYCEGSSILSASNTQASTLQAAEQLCSSDPSCTYISFAGAETGNDANPGASWLCSGDEWLTTAPRTNWVTAVKPDQFILPNFHVQVNKQSICEGSNILSISRGATTPSQAAITCNGDARCTYFSIFFGGSSNIPSNPRVQMVYLCTGSPINSVRADGWMLAERKRLTTTTGRGKGGKGGESEISTEAAEPSLLPPAVSRTRAGEALSASTGSITQDDYYDSVKAGTIVPPRVARRSI